MSSDAARFWNQVPLAESAFPAKYGPKFRCRTRAKTAAGPVVELTVAFYPRRAVLRATGFVELRVDRPRGLRGHPGHALELLLGCCQEALRRAEVLHQRAPPHRPHTGQ